MQKKKNTPRWRVYCCSSENGWVSFHARRTDLRKERKGETRAVTLGWNGERFANTSELDRFLGLQQDVREDIMRQMREILERGLPTPPEGFPGAYLEAS